MKFEDIKVGEEYLVDAVRLTCIIKKEKINELDIVRSIWFADQDKTHVIQLYEKGLHRVLKNPTTYKVGKVYKNKEDNHLFYVTELNKKRQPLGYGFIPGIFVEFNQHPWDDEFLDFDTELATQIEWQEALIEEAKKRGFKFTSIHVCGNNEVRIADKEGNLSTIFKDGEWAEIIEYGETPKKLKDIDVKINAQDFSDWFKKHSEHANEDIICDMLRIADMSETNIVMSDFSKTVKFNQDLSDWDVKSFKHKH